MVRIKEMVAALFGNCNNVRGSNMHNIGIKWEQWGIIVTKTRGFNDENWFKFAGQHFWKIFEILDCFWRELQQDLAFFHANGHDPPCSGISSSRGRV